MAAQRQVARASVAALLFGALQCQPAVAVRLDEEDDSGSLQMTGKMDKVVETLQDQEREAAAQVAHITTELKQAEAADAAASRRAEAYAEANHMKRQASQNFAIPFHGAASAGHVLEDVLAKQQALEKELNDVKQKVDLPLAAAAAPKNSLIQQQQEQQQKKQTAATHAHRQQVQQHPPLQPFQQMQQQQLLERQQLQEQQAQQQESLRHDQEQEKLHEEEQQRQLNQEQQAEQRQLQEKQQEQVRKEQEAQQKQQDDLQRQQQEQQLRQANEDRKFVDELHHPQQFHAEARQPLMATLAASLKFVPSMPTWQMLKPSLYALGALIPFVIVYFMYRIICSRQAVKQTALQCRVISKRKVAILAEPAVDAEVTDYLEPDTVFIATLQVVPADTRTYYQLADGRGWVPECSRKDINKPIVRVESPQMAAP